MQDLWCYGHTKHSCLLESIFLNYSLSFTKSRKLEIGSQVGVIMAIPVTNDG